MKIGILRTSLILFALVPVAKVSKVNFSLYSKALSPAMLIKKLATVLPAEIVIKLDWQLPTKSVAVVGISCSFCLSAVIVKSKSITGACWLY